MTRRMADPEFRRQQRDGLYGPHVAPLNRLVEEFGGGERGWLPHIAPVHGGVHAQLLWVLRDPGPAVADPENAEAGFLCVENNDATAARLCELLERAHIPVSCTLPWNAYPWYVNRAPTVAELRAGVEPLRRVITLMPQLRVLLLLGKHAERSWKLLMSSGASVISGVEVLHARHPSRQAFIGTAESRRVWREEQAVVVEQAGRLLERPCAPPTRSGAPDTGPPGPRAAAT